MSANSRRVRQKHGAEITQKAARQKYQLSKSFFVYWDSVFTRITPRNTQNKRFRYYYEDEIIRLLIDLGRPVPMPESTIPQ